MNLHRNAPLSVGLALGLAATVLASCSSSSSSTPSTVPASAACSPSALAKATAPVQLTFWESFPRANGQALQTLTDKFNASQSKVHVNLVVQATYQDTFAKVQSGLATGQLPDIAQLTDTDTQGAIDTQAFIPVQSCIDSFGYNTADFLPRALAYWHVQGSQWAMPFGVSGPVLYYNKLAFQKAGLNPAAPPATLSALVSDANTLKTKGQGGIGLLLDPWDFQTWLSTDNSLFANNENGRSARATKVVFNTPAGLSVFKALSQMAADGSASTNEVQGAGRYDNLLGVGSGKYAMTIDTSAALGTVEQVLSTGAYPNVQLGVAPFPKLTATSTGGVEPGGQGLWISKRSSAAQRAAAWTYIAFLDSTESQVFWSTSTGYIPLRTSAANSAAVQAAWAKDPNLKVAYTQLTGGISTPATAGPVVGPSNDVYGAISDAEASIFVSNTPASTALNAAFNNSNTIIASYNTRLGVG